MTTPASGTWWRPLVPLVIPVLAGAALGVALQVAEPGIQLYAAVAPGLLAGLAGLLATVVLAAVRLTRQRAAMAAEAAERDAMVRAADDRLRFLMRLDHELKNPLTAIRAGLANIEQAEAMARPAPGGAALASVSAQASRITRLLGDLRKLADLETREIETARLTCPACCRRWTRPSPRSPRRRAGHPGGACRRRHGRFRSSKATGTCCSSRCRTSSPTRSSSRRPATRWRYVQRGR